MSQTSSVTDMLDPDEVLGTAWVARLRREHERHEGLPVYPGTGHMHPPFQRRVPMITSAMLREQRSQLSRALDVSRETRGTIHAPDHTIHNVAMPTLQHELVEIWSGLLVAARQEA